MTTKNLTTGYYRIIDNNSGYDGDYIWTKQDWPYLLILYEAVFEVRYKWSIPELLQFRDSCPVPDLMFIVAGMPLAEYK